MSERSAADVAWLVGRELDRLSAEIEAYDDESDLWVTRGGQKNAPGTLALHLVGNLMHYIGTGLGETGYVRDRDAEFNDRDVPRTEILRRIASCRDTVTGVLERVDDATMSGTFPGEPPERLRGITTRRFLLHLCWHLGWHVGQIYYHRLSARGDAD